MPSLFITGWVAENLNGIFIGMALFFLAVGGLAFLTALRRLEGQVNQLNSLEMLKSNLRGGGDHQDVRRRILVGIRSEERQRQWEKRRQEDACDYAWEIAAALREHASAVPLSSMIGMRLLVICSMTQRSSASPAMPALEELEQLTREYELTRGPVWMLRGITNIILMCGICGTLWGVSQQLDKNVFNLSDMVNSLWPSMVAVVGFIILCLLQGLFHGRLESQIKRLDDLTLSVFVPLFLPESPWLRHEEACRRAANNLHITILQKDAKTFCAFLKKSLLPKAQAYREGMEECARVLWATGALLLRRASGLMQRRKRMASRRRALAGALVLVLELARAAEERYEQMHRHMSMVLAELGRLAPPLQAHCRALGDKKQQRRVNRVTKNVTRLAQYSSPKATLISLIQNIEEFRKQIQRSLADLAELHRRVKKAGIALEEYEQELTRQTRQATELTRQGEQLLADGLALMPEVEQRASVMQQWGAYFAESIALVANYHRRLQQGFCELRTSWRRGVLTSLSMLHRVLTQYDLTAHLSWHRALLYTLVFAGGAGAGLLTSVYNSRSYVEAWKGHVQPPVLPHPATDKSPHHHQ